MSDKNNELFGQSLHQAIGVIAKYNSESLGSALLGQLVGQITGKNLSGANLLAAQIDEISQTQHLVNQINEFLNAYGVGVRVTSIGSIQIRGGTSDIQRFVPFISDVPKFERSVSENNKESELLASFMADCIMKYGAEVQLAIHPREVMQIESDELLMDVVFIVSGMSYIPEGLNEIVSRYRKGELLGYIILEKYFSGELEDIMKHLEKAISEDNFYDISVIICVFRDFIAVLKWAVKNSPTILDEYKVRLLPRRK